MLVKNYIVCSNSEQTEIPYSAFFFLFHFSERKTQQQLVCGSTFVMIFVPQDAVRTSIPDILVLNAILGIFKEKVEHV